MNEKRFCFVILHYLETEVTCQCINSILDNIEYDNYKIVVVDNASPNRSGKRLKMMFEENLRIHVILRKENDGFARGNNVGYKYAKEVLGADFIVCINNDVLIEQPDFLNKIMEICTKENCEVLGPDIISPDGKKQNPRRTHSLSRKEIKQHIIRKEILLAYFYWRKYIFKINFIEKWIKKAYKKEIESRNSSGSQANVVLLGACIIYCPTFVMRENKAFSPITFMYGEEDLLALYCVQKGYNTFYSTEISIIHLDGYSTKSSQKTDENRMIFLYKNIIKGLKLLEKEMKKGNNKTEK